MPAITKPPHVANGDNDRIITTINSQILACHLPNARRRIYPDTADEYWFQYPREFAELVTEFLSGV